MSEFVTIGFFSVPRLSGAGRFRATGDHDRSSDSDRYIYQALVELQLKKFPEAADNARQAITRNPQARGYHFVLGLILEAQGNRDAAIAAFNTELREHPDNAPAAAELQKSELTE